MKTSGLGGPTFRTLALIAFAAGCLGFLGYLYAQAGGRLPFSGRATQYKVAFDLDHVGNLVQFADVVEAGVRVGKVDSLDRVTPQTIRVVLTLDTMAAPLHEGLVVDIIERSLLGQPTVKLTDGTGPAFPNGALLPPAAIHPPVTLREVLASLDTPSRAALGGVIRSLGTATAGRRPEVAQLAGGLANFGNQGDVALAALAAQSGDLADVARELRQVFDALDVGQGQIADLVTSANKLSRATADQRPALEATVRKLPGTLDSATAASADVSRISHSLTPVGGSLDQAAPDLDKALLAMPDTSSYLRRTLPDLQATLDDAPDTLHRIPDFGRKARHTFPLGVDLMRELNPMARYLKPYGKEISQFFAGFGAGINHYGDDGSAYLYVRATAGAQTVRTTPLVLPGLVMGKNPYVSPGGLADLRPFVGGYPRVERDPN